MNFRARPQEDRDAKLLDTCTGGVGDVFVGDSRRGTCFHLGNRYMVTNVHVLPNKADLNKATMRFSDATFGPADTRYALGFYIEDEAEVFEEFPDVVFFSVGRWCEDVGASKSEETETELAEMAEASKTYEFSSGGWLPSGSAVEIGWVILGPSAAPNRVEQVGLTALGDGVIQVSRSFPAGCSGAPVVTIVNGTVKFVGVLFQSRDHAFAVEVPFGEFMTAYVTATDALRGARVRGTTSRGGASRREPQVLCGEEHVCVDARGRSPPRRLWAPVARAAVLGVSHLSSGRNRPAEVAPVLQRRRHDHVEVLARERERRRR